MGNLEIVHSKRLKNFRKRDKVFNYKSRSTFHALIKPNCLNLLNTAQIPFKLFPVQYSALSFNWKLINATYFQKHFSRNKVIIKDLNKNKLIFLIWTKTKSNFLHLGRFKSRYYLLFTLGQGYLTFVLLLRSQVWRPLQFQCLHVLGQLCQQYFFAFDQVPVAKDGFVDHLLRRRVPGDSLSMKNIGLISALRDLHKRRLGKERRKLAHYSKKVERKQSSNLCH